MNRKKKKRAKVLNTKFTVKETETPLKHTERVYLIHKCHVH